MSETAQKQSPWRQKPTKGGDFEVPPADNHLARLVAMLDLGTHARTFKEKVTDVHQIYLCWELLGCPMSGSKFNHVIGERYTLSLSPKAHLTAVVRTLLGKDYREDGENDLANMLGRSCMVEVKHVAGGEGKTYANVAAVSSVPSALAKNVPQAMRKPLLWSLGDDLHDLQKADWLPWCYGQRLPEVVAACRELTGIRRAEAGQPVAGGTHGTSTDEEIPF